MKDCTGNIDSFKKSGAKVGDNVCVVGDIHYSSEPYLITVGKNTTISFDCALITHDASTRVIRNLPGKNKETVIYGTIDIGENCFIGARTTILPNVKIGNNTIIGACSLVNTDIPDNVVAAGVPCKVICSLSEYIEKHEKDFLYIVSYDKEKKKKYLLNHFGKK